MKVSGLVGFWLNIEYAKMADGACGSLSDALDTKTKISVITETEHHCWVRLKLELKCITSELKSAMEMTEILKEELGITDTADRRNKTIIHNKGSGMSISRGEGDGTQVQMNQDGKKIDKLKEHSAPFVRINNRFEVLANLRGTSYPTDLRNEMIHSSRERYNNMDKDSLSRKINAIVNHIPVIVNGETITNNYENLGSYMGFVCTRPK